MNVLKVRNLTIGEGIPKICVPIVGVTKEAILESAALAAKSDADLVEWRADFYENVDEVNKVERILEKLRQILGDMPILFTFRTSREGGNRAISPIQYEQLNLFVARTGYADLIDVEMFWEELDINSFIKSLQECGVRIIGSNHDFEKTPCKEELIHRLCYMQNKGADIPKIAVMPRGKSDVITLLSATEEMVSAYAERPIITMSMAKDGVISRICGETFGSAVTFGAIGKTSAPGQLETAELKKILQLLHQNR